jgi:Short C-terminal domain
VIARHPCDTHDPLLPVSGPTDPAADAAEPEAAASPLPPGTIARHSRPPSHGTIWGVRALFTLATILSVAGVFAIWANRQVLDADNWAHTSTALLQNSAIRTELSDYLVQQLYANIDVSKQLSGALPPRLKPLAGPVAGGLENLAQKAAYEFLGRPRVQAAWLAANRVTAKQFIDIVEGKSKLVLLNGNAVFIDLRPILGQLTQTLGLPASLLASLPPNAARLKVMTSNQISSVQKVVKLVKGLAVILPLIALLLFALAVYLMRTRRRHALFIVGVDLVVGGAIILIVRNLAGHAIINSLVATASVKPAAQAGWSIGTAMLSDIAQSSIIIGLAVALAAGLAGPRRLAVALRKAAAPWLRERRGVAYSVVLAVLLLIVLWGPIPATREPIPVLITIGLVWLGLVAIGRETALEFPDAQTGDTFAAIRRRFSGTRRRGGGRSAAPGPPPIAGGAGPPWHWDPDERLTLLERLGALRESGVLSEAEFAAEKAQLLGDGQDAAN